MTTRGIIIGLVVTVGFVLVIGFRFWKARRNRQHAEFNPGYLCVAPSSRLPITVAYGEAAGDDAAGATKMAEVIDIGEQGMGLRVAAGFEALHRNTVLDVRITLPRQVSISCRGVVRALRRRRDGGGSFRIEFTQLREDARTKIANYITQVTHYRLDKYSQDEEFTLHG